MSQRKDVKTVSIMGRYFHVDQSFTKPQMGMVYVSLRCVIPMGK